MGLSMPECQRGARVCHMLDSKGRALPKERRRMGTIVKVLSTSGVEDSGDSIESIFVRFDDAKEQEPQKVPNCELVLHKAFDQAAYDETVDRERNMVAMPARTRKP